MSVSSSLPRFYATNLTVVLKTEPLSQEPVISRKMLFRFIRTSLYFGALIGNVLLAETNSLFENTCLKWYLIENIGTLKT